jgi:hypothetical protein
MEVRIVLTGDGDDAARRGVAGEGEKANLGFRVGEGVRGLTCDKLLRLSCWESSSEFEVKEV